MRNIVFNEFPKPNINRKTYRKDETDGYPREIQLLQGQAEPWKTQSRGNLEPCMPNMDGRKKPDASGKTNKKSETKTRS